MLIMEKIKANSQVFIAVDHNNEVLRERHTEIQREREKKKTFLTCRQGFILVLALVQLN